MSREMTSKRRRTCSSDEDEPDHQSSVSESSVTKDEEQIASNLNALNASRNDKELCDVVLCVEDQEIPAHKFMLVSSSPYFKAKFTSGMAEAARNRVPVTGVKADQLRAVLDYLYTGTISITDSNVESILYAANHLQVAKVKDACCIFLKKRLDVTNCLRIGRIAENCACSDLEKKAMKLAQNANWDQLMRCDEFLELSAGRLIKFLSSDSLNVKKEEDLFEAVLSWLNHRPEERTQGFEKIFEHIRLLLMSPYYLLHTVAKTPAVTENKKCSELLEYAKYFYMLPDRRRERSLACTTLRDNSLMVPAAILVGGHDGTRLSRDVDCFVPSQDTWLSLAELPCPVYKHGVAAIDHNSLLVAGGRQKSTSTSAAWCYDPALNTWYKAARMPSKRGRVSLAAVDGCVYAVSAPAGELEVSVKRYDPVVNQWDPVKEMKIELLHSPVATSQGGRLLVSGVFKEGDDAKGCIQSYDPYTDSWEVLSSSLPLLHHSSSCAYKEKLYLVGGWDKVKNESIRSMICIDTETATWSDCESMQEGRASPGVAVIAGKMFVFGGSKNIFERKSGVNSMEIYDLETNRWLGKETMKRKRCWHGCVVLNIPKRMLESKAAKQ